MVTMALLCVLLAEARPTAMEESPMHHLREWQEFTTTANNYTDTI